MKKKIFFANSISVLITVLLLVLASNAAVEDTLVPTTPLSAIPITKTRIVLQTNNPYMQVNGKREEIEPGRMVSPLIIDGRTMVPIRAIAEAIGGKVDWADYTKTALVNYKNKTVKISALTKRIYLDKTPVKTDVPPTVVNGRLMIPLRAIFESLDIDVGWEPNLKLIILNVK